MELILVLFAVVAVIQWRRQSSLRRELSNLTHTSAEQNDALHRELLELRRKVAVLETAKVADVATKPIADAAPQVVSVVHPQVEQVEKVVPAPRPAEPAAKTFVVETPASEKTRPVERITQLAFCASCRTVHAGGVENCPPDKTAARSTEATQPVSEPAAKTPAEAKPAVPANLPPAAASVIPASPAKSVSPATAPPPPPRSVQPQAAARVAAPTQFSALHAPVPKPTAQQRMKSVFALEETLGTNWLNKLGIIILVLGIALFGIYELGQAGPGMRVGISYTVSLAFLGGGIFLEKRERYRVLGRTLIGGGWALLFFTTYALNHVQAMRVLGSETFDLILMLAAALAMVVHTLRYRSQLVTGLAFLLAYGTVSLSHDDVYSLASGVILAIGLVSIVIKMGWFELEVFGIISGYLTHLYWLYRLLGAQGANGTAFPEYHASTALLLFYWLIFRISYIVRKVKTPMDEHVSTAAALLNTLLLLGVMKFQSVQPKLAFVALLAIGAIEFGFGQIPITKRRREAFIVLSVLGAALMLTAVPFRYSGNNVAILWLVGGQALLIAGVTIGEVVFRRLGLVTGLLVGLHLAGIDFMQLMSVRRTSEDVVLVAGVIFALCAIVFYLDAFLVGRRWKRFFSESPDAPLLDVHSYLGAFAAVAAAWALCVHDWTAIAFAGIMLILAGLGQRLKSFHLQVQYGFIAVLTLYRVVLFNLHTEIPQYTHAQSRLLTLPLLAAVFYVTAKWSQLYDVANQRYFRGFFAFAGTALVALLIYYEVPELWQATAAIVFAVLLLEIGQWSGYHTLAWHSHLLTGLAVLAAMNADQSGSLRWHDIPLHAFGALPVVGGAYWIAMRIRVSHADHSRLGRIAYRWLGTIAMLWVLNEAVPRPWIAVSWIAFAVALALVMRRIGFRQLAWQANFVAACTLVRVYTTNYALEQTLWPGISLRLVTVSIVALGLYFLSRKAVIADSLSGRVVTYLHSTAATALLAYLAWYEAPGAWLAAVWAVFALILALIDRRFALEDLGWQAHALAALAMMRSVTLNLYITETWHGVSVRLLSLAIVAVIFYALSRLVRMPQEWRARDFHHIYSWAASALVALLMWYELQPLSVAVGWGVFGLVLFEYGLLRDVKQFRFQSYVALASAFGRIFFANLTAGTPGEWLGPRIYSVLPLTLIFFFVYAQLTAEQANVRDERRLHIDDLLGYIGSGSVVALLYFQLANVWLVTGWALAVLVLFAVALLLDRKIFLYQGILLTLGTCVRGVMHNLFGASYFSGGDWTGRYFVLGSAIAVLLACLPFAFRLRDRYRTQPSNNWIGALIRRPEQFMFFAPVLLLTLMLALKMRAGMVTVSWGIEGFAILLSAFAINERSFRLTGLLLLLVCFAKIVIIDMWGLGPRDRYITLIIVGAAILSASFLYSKYRDTIRQFL